MKVADLLSGKRVNPKMTIDKQLLSPEQNKDRQSPLNEYDEKSYHAGPSHKQTVRTNGLTFDYDDIENLQSIIDTRFHDVTVGPKVPKTTTIT